jgi:preprotein translocase subunit SecA
VPSRLSFSWQRWNNDRKLAPLLVVAEAIAAREAPIAALTDAELRELANTHRLDARSDDSRAALESEREVAIEVEVFALVRESAQRTLSQRPFDVQILAGLAMARGQLAEMATGEGKTLCAVAPACLLALQGRGLHPRRG